ncbi:MAG: cation:dicarboxylate symporter family transporter [Brachybacterium sp.]|uniref:cation:dicarboxylate symporter family transporter n=1 Tax=Brachybacterium sp. TaxID=1891286 RepID=UPI003F914C85
MHTYSDASSDAPSDTAVDPSARAPRRKRFGLLPRILLAIVLGILLGLVMPEALARIFTTFNGVFSGFLGFLIPLIIVGLVTPAIAELGHGAGKMLAATVVGKKRTLTASHPSGTSRWPAHHVRAPDDTANPATFRTALPSRALGVAHA